MKNTAPKHIREIIRSYLNSRNWAQRMDGYHILQWWDEIIPKKIALNIKPVKIQNNTLFVTVKNHVWANEARIRKGEMINLINKKMGAKDKIDNINISIYHKRFK